MKSRCAVRCRSTSVRALAVVEKRRITRFDEHRGDVESTRTWIYTNWHRTAWCIMALR